MKKILCRVREWLRSFLTDAGLLHSRPAPAQEQERREQIVADLFRESGADELLRKLFRRMQGGR